MTNELSQTLIEKINFYQWKNTRWNGDVVPIEVCQDKSSSCSKGDYIVKVYGKALGIIPENGDRLPLNKRFYAYLITDNDYVLAAMIDEELRQSQLQIKGYSRPQWELDLIKIARNLGINTEVTKQTSLQTAKVWDYTFIYSRETETLYLMSSREKRGKLYQVRRTQPAKIYNLTLEDLAFFAQQKRKIELQDKLKTNLHVNTKNKFKFFTNPHTGEFTEECLRLLKYYEREYLIISESKYGEYEYDFQTHYLREWLKRNEIPEDEIMDENQLKIYINDYVYFLYWLITYKASDLFRQSKLPEERNWQKIDLPYLISNGEFIEDFYGDEEVKEYKESCRQEAEIAEAENAVTDWEFRLQAEKEFEEKYGGLEDGEYQLMRYLEGLDDVPEEPEQWTIGNEERIIQTKREKPHIVVSYSDDEVTSKEIFQLWSQYAEMAGLKVEEHLEILGEEKEGYYPQVHTIQVSKSLLQAMGNNPIDLVFEKEF